MPAIQRPGIHPPLAVGWQFGRQPIGCSLCLQRGGITVRLARSMPGGPPADGGGLIGEWRRCCTSLLYCRPLAFSWARSAPLCAKVAANDPRLVLDIHRYLLERRVCEDPGSPCRAYAVGAGWQCQSEGRVTAAPTGSVPAFATATIYRRRSVILPYAGVGMAPSCWKRPNAFITTHCSATLPPSRRKTSIDSNLTSRPVAGTPTKSPWCVPRIETRTAT